MNFDNKKFNGACSNSVPETPPNIDNKPEPKTVEPKISKHSVDESNREIRKK